MFKSIIANRVKSEPASCGSVKDGIAKYMNYKNISDVDIAKQRIVSDLEDLNIYEPTMDHFKKCDPGGLKQYFNI